MADEFGGQPVSNGDEFGGVPVGAAPTPNVKDSANQAIRDFVSGAASKLNPLKMLADTADAAKAAWNDPIDTAIEILGHQYKALGRAKDAFSDGKYEEAAAHLASAIDPTGSVTEGATVKAATPGQRAEGFGELFGTGLQAYLGAKAPEALSSAKQYIASKPGIGKLAAGAAGAIAGHATGIPYGGALGAAAGRMIAGDLTGGTEATAATPPPLPQQPQPGPPTPPPLPPSPMAQAAQEFNARNAPMTPEPTQTPTPTPPNGTVPPPGLNRPVPPVPQDYPGSKLLYDPESFMQPDKLWGQSDFFKNSSALSSRGDIAFKAASVIDKAGISQQDLMTIEAHPEAATAFWDNLAKVPGLSKQEGYTFSDATKAAIRQALPKIQVSPKGVTVQ